jgi:hypothetical protein
MHKFLNLFPYLLLPYTLSPSSRGTMYKFCSGSSLLGMVSTSGPVWKGTVPTWPSLYIVPLEDGLKESPKHVRQKQIRK